MQALITVLFSNEISIVESKYDITFWRKIVTYAKDNDMILISADVENQKGCIENDIKFVPINNEIILQVVLDGLKKFND